MATTYPPKDRLIETPKDLADNCEKCPSELQQFFTEDYNGWELWCPNCNEMMSSAPDVAGNIAQALGANPDDDPRDFLQKADLKIEEI